MSNPARTEEDITRGLLAYIRFAGNASAAAEALADDGMHISPGTLHAWARERHWQRYEELRDKHATEIEASMIADLRESAALALQAQRRAVEKALERLDGNNDDDPGRTAANLSRVSQSNIDKMLGLSGRPTQITENRDVSQLIRGLQASFPQVFPDPGPVPAELEASDDQ